MKTRLSNRNRYFRTFLAKFMHLVSPIILTLPAAATSEELTNVKVIGGFSAECTESNLANTNYLQPITFNMIDFKKLGSTTYAEFEIQFVECAKNKWSKLKSIKTEFNRDITDEIKQNYKEKTTYSQFRVEIKNAKGDTVQTIPLTATNKAKFTFKVKLNSLDFAKEEKTKTKFVDVILMASRSRQNAADYYYEEVNWGSLRLPLTQIQD